ncbi:hypothetical protein M758_11G040800 [Ceratodon purpureus]|nr:hypothetical protein M758_11G040800 [Ceratodon purpureus]
MEEWTLCILIVMDVLMELLHCFYTHSVQTMERRVGPCGESYRYRDSELETFDFDVVSKVSRLFRLLPVLSEVLKFRYISLQTVLGNGTGIASCHCHCLSFKMSLPFDIYITSSLS